MEKISKASSVKSGLGPEDSRSLNRLNFPNKGAMEASDALVSRLRDKYANDPKALQQIDVFDARSPYQPKIDALSEALSSGDTIKAKELKDWLRENYPDI